MTIGVLALQGDVREHRAAFGDLGQATREVRTPGDLVDLAGIVLPGGESTTLSMLLESSGLFDPLAVALHSGLAVFGTCAGLVLLSSEVRGGRDDQRCFGALDCVVERNGYGRQAESFESWIDVPKVSAELGTEDRPMPAVFIRAPVIESVGPDVEVLASIARPGGDPMPVVLRQGNALASAFHPELTSDRRLHELFVSMAAA
jgi:5'-phosphate synthase pdxT subunit